jgi:hypothetical protein
MCQIPSSPYLPLSASPHHIDVDEGNAQVKPSAPFRGVMQTPPISDEARWEIALYFITMRDGFIPFYKLPHTK